MPSKHIIYEFIPPYYSWLRDQGYTDLEADTIAKDSHVFLEAMLVHDDMHLRLLVKYINQLFESKYRR